ncbi:putative EF-hand domain-containing protein [Dioscorea sansibarensis]
MEKPPMKIKPSPSFRLRTSSLNTLRLRRIFDLFDGNGDGEITTAELCAALDRLGLGADPTEIGTLVKAHAPAGRPGLDFPAFESLHRALGDELLGVAEEEEEKGAEAEGDMEEAFRVFDEDGDGFISARELQAVLGKLGLVEGRSLQTVHEMICSVDRNSDGLVDFGEFKSMMRGIAVAVPGA